MPYDADQIANLDAELDALDSPTTAEVLDATEDYDDTIVAASAVRRALNAGGGGGGSQPGTLVSAAFLFTEEATAGTYTATLPVLDGSVIDDIALYNYSDPSTGAWAADTAVLDVGDNTDPQNFYKSVTMGADLLADGIDNPYPATLDPSAGRSLRAYTTFPNGDNNWSGLAAAAFTSLTEKSVRDSAGSGVTPAFAPGSLGVGYRYTADDLITMTLVTTIGSPPVVPTGVLLVRVTYFTPITPVAASFA